MAMADYIMNAFQGSKVTLAVTGLPVVITGEVMSNSTRNIINLKLEGNVIMHINANLIAFVF